MSKGKPREIMRLGQEYLTADKTKTGEVFTIIEVSDLMDTQFKDKDGKPRQRYQIKVSPKDDKNKVYNITLNATSSDGLRITIGTNPEKWIGQKLQVEILDSLVQGTQKKVLIFTKAE